MNYNQVQFIKSAASPADFIHDRLPKIVFSGKSNVGKSSVINRLINRKNFARVGNTPGKTVHVNYFLIDENAYFADLPGYGYAKVSKSERARWSRLMEDFFACYEDITLGVMIVDARHRPTGDDITMAQWFIQTACPMVVIANKCDKLKKSETENNVAVIRDALQLPAAVPVILFSAEKGTGKDALKTQISKYL